MGGWMEEWMNGWGINKSVESRLRVDGCGRWTVVGW